MIDIKISDFLNCFICPISLEIMINPVVLSDGISYER